MSCQYRCYTQAKSAYCRREQGFTLIEVMGALAIFAMVAIVASQASGTYLRSVNNLKVRTLAQFVAQNIATDLTLNPTAITREQTRQVESQGRAWLVTVAPQIDPNLSQYASPSMTQSMSQSTGSNGSSPFATLTPVQITVAPMDEAGQVANSVADLTVVVRQHAE